MLKNLHIVNFAIVDQLDLDFTAGMTALTGETGAGKSILLGALGLVLGDRASSNSIRHGQQRAEISASFELSAAHSAKQWLLQQELLDADDNECLLRRTINQDGRSKCYINDRPVTLNSLRELSMQLVNIHGQHEHQLLVKSEAQRQRLDDYAEHDEILQRLKTLYQDWRQIAQDRQQLYQATQQRNDQLQMLRAQAEEFAQLELSAEEWEQLHIEHQRLSHAQSLLAGAEQALLTLYNDDQSAYSLLTQQQRQLTELSAIDHTLNEVVTALDDASIQLSEAAEQLKHYVADIPLDAERLNWIEQRISAIHSVARKHRVEPENLPDVQAQVQQTLDDLENADQRLDELDARYQQLTTMYLQCAQQLSQQRRLAAERLSAKITERMQTLGMAGGQFSIAVKPKPQDAETGAGFSANGLDDIEFLVSAAAGQALQALGKVASGGELSRISLAIQITTADQESIPSLMFDEVDAGIGGGVAEIVGDLLRRLGERQQVFCITHLPQVAAQAHHHFRVSKRTNKDITPPITVTQVEPLEMSQRIEEIARMLGGVTITATTRSHAKEMLATA